MDIDRQKIVVMRIKRKATEPPLSALGAFLYITAESVQTYHEQCYNVPDILH